MLGRMAEELKMRDREKPYVFTEEEKQRFRY
jgi:hypothetical protein